VKVLVVRSRYRDRGGEDVAVDADIELLAAAGHDVVTLERWSADVDITGPTAKVSLAASTVWSRRAAGEVARAIADERPDVVHIHNTFPLLSGSAVVAAGRAAVPLVVSLHNYRLVCPVAVMVRDGGACDDCVGSAFAWRGVVHGCYRGSRAETALVATSSAVHRALRTWTARPDVVVVPSAFARDVLCRGGAVDRERVAVRANAVRDFGRRSPGPGEHVLFAARLSQEKGVDVLLATARRLPDLRFVVAGGGPMADLVRCEAPPNVDVRGQVDPGELGALLHRARLAVVPSLAPESFGLAAMEAFSAALPVVAARSGALAEAIDDGQTGVLVPPGDPVALADAVDGLWHDAGTCRRLGDAARKEYERRYTAVAALAALEAVYERARRRRTTARLLSVNQPSDRTTSHAACIATDEPPDISRAR
jgi:glycosyltransferase involved in cell wall biosynthesis